MSIDTIPVGEAARLALVNRDGLSFAIRRGHIKVFRDEKGQNVVKTEDALKLKKLLWERV